MKRKHASNPRRQPQPRHTCPENGRVLAHAKVVTLAGADYVCSNAHNCDLVMFNSRESGSTLCIHERLLTLDAVRKHLVDSNKKFGLETPPAQ